MRIVGLDTSSRFGGLALVVNSEIQSASVWTPSNPKLSHPRRLQEYRDWLKFKLKMLHPDVAAIEELAVFQSKKTIRVLSHFEAAGILVSKDVVGSVAQIQVTTARRIVFGKGNMSKDDAWDYVKKNWDFDFGHKTTGGLDKMDAAVIALAAPEFLERG